MGHGHDDKGGHGAAHGDRDDHGGHGAGHGDAQGAAHGAGGHGHGPGGPPPPPAPPTPEVLAIARATRWLGLLGWAVGAAAALWYFGQGQWSCVGWSAFVSVYGFSVWLAARETLFNEPAPTL